MTKRSRRPVDDVVGQFWVGESIPLKNCWLRVAHVENGVLVLALDGFTQRGMDILADLKAQQMAQDFQEVQADTLTS